jgi:DNA-binding response OmpR family regulator
MVTISDQYKELMVQLGEPRILVVDDNLELLEELKDVLGGHGYQVETYSDSQEALDMSYTSKPELILLDLKMGPKSGFQVADELHHSLITKHIPIIAMTGFYTEKEHILMMKLCGIKMFILKPFQPGNLIAKIEFALGHQQEEYEH